MEAHNTTKRRKIMKWRGALALLPSDVPFTPVVGKFLDPEPASVHALT